MGVHNKASLPSRSVVMVDKLTYDSCPPGVICVGILMFAVPNNFPYHGVPSHEASTSRQAFSTKQLNQLDLIGTALLLGASVLLVTGLQQAGGRYPWNSPFIISCLVLCAVLWLCFFAWSKHTANQDSIRASVFPWRMVQSRIRLGMLM